MNKLGFYLAIQFVFGVANASDDVHDHSVSIHRNDLGQLTADSQENVALLRKEAAQRGYITLWLTANVPYNPVTEKLSNRQISKQKRNVKETLRAALKPLIAAGMVQHAPERPNIEGPGRLVRATAEGVQRLVHDTRIKHIIRSE